MLNPLAHEHSAAIDKVARWLAGTPRHDRPGPVLFELRQRFDMTAREASMAAKLAAIIQGRTR